MSVEGIWAIEVHSAYGWESRGVLTLENGRAIGGGDRHYTIGRYSLSDGKIRIESVIHYFGEPRTVFGERRAEYTVVIEGETDDGGIEGMMSRPDRPQFKLEVRMTRMLDLH